MLQALKFTFVAVLLNFFLYTCFAEVYLVSVRVHLLEKPCKAANFVQVNVTTTPSPEEDYKKLEDLLLGIGNQRGSTTKKRLIISPYEAEETPSLLFPNSLNLNTDGQNQTLPSQEAEYLSYDVFNDLFNNDPFNKNPFNIR